MAPGESSAQPRPGPWAEPSLAHSGSGSSRQRRGNIPALMPGTDAAPARGAHLSPTPRDRAEVALPGRGRPPGLLPGAAAVARRPRRGRPAPEGGAGAAEGVPGGRAATPAPPPRALRPSRPGRPAGRRRDAHLVSWLLNFLVTTLPSSRPSRSATRWDRSWCELPLNSTMLGMVGREAAAARAAAAGAGKRGGRTEGGAEPEELQGAEPGRRGWGRGRGGGL